MRRAARLLLGSAGAIGGLVFLRRHPRPAPDPAEELRRKLVEARGSEVSLTLDAPASPPQISAAEEEAEAVAQQSASESSETGEPVSQIDALRREVHARGRAAVEEMRGPSPDE